MRLPRNVSTWPSRSFFAESRCSERDSEVRPPPSGVGSCGRSDRVGRKNFPVTLATLVSAPKIEF